MVNKVYSLKRSSSFKEAAVAGKKIRLSSWLTIQILDSFDSKSYFGITASRKVGGAVIRNKLKRWVRNYARSESWPSKFKNKTVVFVFRAQTKENFYEKLKYAEFFEVFKKVEA